MDNRNPKTCGESMKFQVTYICRLQCCPCFVLKSCAKDDMDKFVKSMIKISEEDK